MFLVDNIPFHEKQFDISETWSQLIYQLPDKSPSAASEKHYL